MSDIKHLVTIDAPIPVVYMALTEQDGLATCNYHWGFYMRSLKSYCETGKGQPFSQSES